MDDDKKLQQAVRIYRHVPSAGTEFVASDAMQWAGISEAMATTDSYKRKFFALLNAFEQRHGPPPPLSLDDKTVGKRYYFLWKNRPEKCPLKQPDVMKLAGADKKNCGSGNLYVRCKRLRDADEEPECVDIDPSYTVAKKSSEESTVDSISVSTITGSEQSNVSPMSIQSNLSQPLISAKDDILHMQIPLKGMPNAGLIKQLLCANAAELVETFGEKAATPPYFDFTRKTDSSIRVNAMQKLKVDVAKEVQRMTIFKESCQTSEARQAQRQRDETLTRIRSSAYKLGTLLLDCVVKGDAPLSDFAGKNKVAAAINGMFGIELVSGRQLLDGINDNQVGKSPPKRGRAREIGDDEFKDLCVAFFTLSSIEQANCAERLDRPQLTSLLGALLQDKHPEKNEVHLYEQILQSNSCIQDVASVDTRDAIRVSWLTYNNQLKHHQNFEDFCVEFGFARRPTSKKEENLHGHIVYHSNQPARICNIDEVNIPLDGSSTVEGGRPAMTMVDPSLPESGKQKQKSDKSCTVIFGCTGAHEALPPLFVFPSTAKLPENYRLRWTLLESFPQVEGQYGYSKRRHFDVGFAINQKGGTNEELFEKFVCEHVMSLYPDAQDVPGKRLLLQTDTGPGRLGAMHRFRTKAEGVYIYPGMPNGTEAGQACDQLFSYLKTVLERNRKRLYNARVKAEGDGATLSLVDVGYLVFGGEVCFEDGTKITLEPAFAMALDNKHIERAQRKVGYVPATRNALRNSRIRHEVVENANGSVDQDADPYGSMLLELEAQNHAACERLVAHGYSQANDLLKRYIRRITQGQSAGRIATITEKNTRERQELLAKATCAGDFFHVTNGGGPMNSTDALLGYVLKTLDQEVDALLDKKEQFQKLQSKSDVAARTMSKPYSTWLVKDFQVVIRWKQGVSGPQKGDAVTGKSKAQLKSLWETKYCDMADPLAVWTEEDEAKLNSLQQGEIGSVEEQAIYGKALDANNEYIKVRLLTVSSARRKEILENVFMALPLCEKELLLQRLSAN